MKHKNVLSQTIGCFPLVIFVASVCGAEFDYQAQYLYLGESPDNDSPGWYYDPVGLAHSNTHWFITESQRIWRIPVSANLGSVDADSPGVSTRYLDDIPELSDEGYLLFGDPCSYRYGNIDYLFVPVGKQFLEPLTSLAVFRGDSTNPYFITVADFPINQFGILGADWCGIDSDGFLYSMPQFQPKSVQRFAVNWTLLAQNSVLSLVPETRLWLLKEDGTELDHFHYLKIVSGDISPDGAIVYLDILADGYSIETFDMSSGRRMQSSTRGSGYFNFDVAYDPPDYTEGAGLTIWDLEGTGSPHSGNLHVIVKDIDIFSGSEVGIKHYTRTIRVDATHNGDQEGTPGSPFKTIAGALSFAWDGAEVRILSNHYPEALIFDKRVRVTAEGGPVHIGE